MANTGIKLVLTDKEVESPCPYPYTGCTCAPGCPTKPNVVGDPNYIAPYQDLIACPITYSEDCPVPIYTTGSTTFEIEFSLNNDVVTNPSIAHIVLSITGGGTFSFTFTLPNTPSPNWFSHVFTGLTGATSYTLTITYTDSSNSVIATCPAINFTTS
jgi:hypothetical protein